MEVKCGFIILLLLCIIPICKSRTCTETRSNSQQQSYTSYYTTSHGYTTSCGWWGWSRCSRTRYQRNSRRLYRTTTSYYTACCSGYTCGSNCRACCSPSCKHGGTCDTPNTCICQSGWSGSTCQYDVNECTRSNLCHANARCSNTAGSYTCTCNTGYRGNGRSCTDVNECHSSNSNDCSAHGTCHNTVGSYTCSCNPGYQGNGFTCSDINECMTGHSCDTNAECTNTLGTYTCSCNNGYAGNGFYCNDVNECQLGTDMCHQQATCINNVGSYGCSCNTGYQGNGFTCIDVNECLASNGGCDQVCTNEIASYHCSCEEGYYLGADGHSCEDVDECATQNGGCHHNCHNTIGSYHCSCNGAYSLSADDHTCTVPPSPPTNVQFSMVTTRTARLTWQAPVVTFLNHLTAVSSYRIIARQSSFDISDVEAEVSSNMRSYTFPSTLEEFTVYVCEVLAGNSFGYGLPSQTVQLKTHETIPSAAPIVDYALAVSSSLISLHWLPPPSIHINGMLEYYTVNLTETNTGKKWTFIAVDSVLRIGSLHPDYLYSFSIAARTIGNGPYSPIQTVRTGEDAPSGAPQYLSVSSKTSSSLTLTWEPPLSSERNGIIQLYTVLLEELETDQILEFTSNITNITISSLHPYYYYSCNVRAETILPGPFSDSVLVQLDEDAPSSSPTIVTSNATSSTSVWLEWIPPENDTHNGVIRSYTVLVEEQDTGLVLTYKAEGTSRAITSLHPYYVYKCQVQAFTVANGPPSEPAFILTAEDVPSGAPLNISLVAKTPFSLTVSWELPSPELRNGIITAYFVSITELPGLDYMTNVSTDTTEVNVEDLSPHTSYVLQIAAVNSAGMGPFSANYLTQTAEDAPSESPQNVTVVEVRSDYAVISWTPPPDHLHNGIIREYLVEVTEVTEVTEDGGSVLYRTGTTSIVIPDLHPDASYYVRVAGHTVEEGPYSSQLHLHTLEDIPSGTPVDLVYSNLASTSVTLLWQPPPPLQQNGLIINYKINFTEISTHNSTVYFSNSTSLDVDVLSAFTAYSFSVSAATAVGFGPTSEHILFQTAEDVPTSAPVNLTGISEDSTSISLSWAALPSELLNGILRHYQLDIVEEPTLRSFSVNSSSNQYVLSPLHPYYNYTVSVAATTVGNGPFSSSTTVETQQDVPSGSPSASELEVTSRSLFLSWETLDPQEHNGIITGYTVTIMDLDDQDGNMESYDVVALNLTISDLRPYTTYGLLLSAHTIVGSGPSSDLHTVQTHEEAPIGSPTNVTAVRSDSTSIEIEWTHPPEDTHYGFIREYRLNVTELETGVKWRVVVDAEATTAVLTSLHPYYTYHITIVPVTVEEGDNYTEITIRTAEDVPSAPPADFLILELKSRSFSLSWDPPTAEDTNGIIRKYIVNITEQFTGRQDTLETFNTTMKIHSLHPYTTYLVSVAAFTIGTGPFTSLQQVITLEEIPTAAPVNVSLWPTTPTTLIISWGPPPMEEQNGEIIEYTFFITDENEMKVTEQMTSEMDVVVQNLRPFHLYFVQLAASTAVGMGPLSVPSLIEMPQDAPSSPPLNIEVVDVFAHNFTVMWTPPPEHTHNGIIRRYQLNTTELETGRNFVRETSELFFTFVYLHPYYTYIFTVAAETVSPGPASEDMVTVTLETAPSSVPRNLTPVFISSTSFTLSWSPPPPEHHNGVLTHYLLLVTRLSTHSTESHLSNTTEMIVEGVVPYSEYEVVIAAFTKEGGGPFTDPLILQTEQDAPSVPPTNVTVKQVLSESISLEWTSPELEQLNGELTHYTIRLLELETNSSQDIFSTASEVVLDFLHPFYTYSISVSAITILPGPYTQELFVMTLEDAPSSPPVSIYAESISATSIITTWEPPPYEARNGIIRQYSVIVSADSSWLNYSQVWLTNETELMVTELAPHVTYQIQISAHTISPGPFSTRHSVTTLEAAPSAAPFNLSLSILDPTTTELTWLPPPIHHRNGIIHQYWIELYQRNTSDTAYYSLLREIQEEAFPIIVQDLHPFYEYQLLVSAVTVELGPFSDPISWKMPEDAPATGPLDIVASNITSTDFSVEWLPPAHSDRNGVIRSYSLMLTDINSGVPSLYSVTSNVTSFHFQDLHPAYFYGVEIAAVTISQGPYSELMQVEMAEDIPSGPPADVKEYVVNSTSVQISWHAPLEDERNGGIALYAVILVGNTSNHLTHQNFMFNSTLVELSSLQPFSEYSVSIAASTAVGMGPFSSPRIFHTPEDAPSSSPTIISTNLLTATSFLVKWQLPPLNETNGYIRYFMLNITENETSTTTTVKVYKLNRLIEDLHPFYTYCLHIAAVTVATGPYSEPFIVQTKEAAPSTPPTSISVTQIGSRHVNISWAPPLMGNQNGMIRFYEINLGTPYTEDHMIITSETALTIFSLLPYHLYTLTVAAITLNHGPESNPLEFLTLEDAPNVAPPSFEATNITSTEFRLSWVAPPSTDINGILREYTVSVIEQKSGYYVMEDVEIEAATEFVVSYLLPYTVYNCSVAAITVARGPEAVIVVQTSEEAPGQAPEDVLAEVDGPHTINITWSPPHSQQNGVIRSYLMKLATTDTELIYNSSTTFLILTELEPHTTYLIRVAAVTITPGPYSEAVYAATPETAPYNPPGNCSAIAISSTSIQLSWLPPPRDSINGVLRYYRVLVRDPSEATVYNGIVNADSLEVIVGDLQPHTIYQCTVAAVTVREGPTADAQIQTLEDAPSVAPSSVSTTAINTSIFMTWQPIPLQEQNGIVLQYSVIIYTLATNESQQLETAETSIELTALHPFYLYELIVAAETSAGVGPYSLPVLQQLPAARPSHTVENVSVSVLSPSSVKISWWPPPREFWNGVLTSYTITSHSYRTTDAAAVNDSSLQLESTNSTLHDVTTHVYTIQDSVWANNPDPRFVFTAVVSEERTIDHLHEFFGYRFTIIVSNSAGDSDPETTPVIQLPGREPSGPPVEVEVEVLSSTSISISWQPPAVREWNGIIDSYRIILEDRIGGTTLENEFTMDECWLDCVIEKLEPYTSYSVAVAAISGFGLGPFSDEIQVTTFEDVPSPPLNVSVLTSEHQFLIIWDSPLHKNGIILQYELIYSTSTGSGLQTYTRTTTSRSLVLSNVTTRHEYTLKVRAATSAGFGDYSSELMVTLEPSAEGFHAAGIEVRGVMGWILFVVILLVVLAVIVALIVFYRKYKKMKKLQNNSLNLSEWVRNPLYQDCDAVEESIKDNSKIEDPVNSETDKPQAPLTP